MCHRGKNNCGYAQSALKQTHEVGLGRGHAGNTQTCVGFILPLVVNDRKNFSSPNLSLTITSVLFFKNIDPRL